MAMKCDLRGGPMFSGCPCAFSEPSDRSMRSTTSSPTTLTSASRRHGGTDGAFKQHTFDRCAGFRWFARVRGQWAAPRLGGVPNTKTGPGHDDRGGSKEETVIMTEDSCRSEDQ
jgi:hypothetical protein